MTTRTTVWSFEYDDDDDAPDDDDDEGGNMFAPNYPNAY